MKLPPSTHPVRDTAFSYGIKEDWTMVRTMRHLDWGRGLLNRSGRVKAPSSNRVIQAWWSLRPMEITWALTRLAKTVHAYQSLRWRAWRWLSRRIL